MTTDPKLLNGACKMACKHSLMLTLVTICLHRDFCWSLPLLWCLSSQHRLSDCY